MEWEYLFQDSKEKKLSIPAVLIVLFLMGTLSFLMDENDFNEASLS